MSNALTSKQNLAWFAVAAVMAVLAGGAASFSPAPLSPFSPTGADGGRTRLILIAAADLEPYRPLDPDADFTVAEWPESAYAQSGGALVLAERLDELDGVMLGQPVVAGLPLLEGHFAAEHDLFVAAGRRLMGLPVSTGGLDIVPGDRIDILVSRPLPRDPARSALDPSAAEVRAELILENILVRSVGSSVSGTRRHVHEGGGASRAGVGSRLGIEVSPQEAASLIEATNDFEHAVTVLLRPPHES